MRILAVRLGRAGDMVMTTPALTALIDCFPSAKITLLTSTDGRRLLSDFHPNIDDIWVWNRSGIKGFASKRAIKKQLQKSSFDKIFCFETSKSISKLLGVANTELHLNTGYDSNIHCSKNYLNLVEKACGKHFDFLPTHLNVNPEAEKLVEAELDSIGITASDTLVMLHPSFSGLTKLTLKKSAGQIHRFWPTENFGKLGELISQIKLDNGTHPKVIVDLVPDESTLGVIISNTSHGTVQVLISPPNFERYKALIKRADLFISPNTGPMHIASAVDTRIIALFSKWNPADCGPYMPADRYTILKAEDTEHPESGLVAIEVNDVLQACNSMLLSQ